MTDLPDEIITGVTIGNLKSISEQPAMLSNLAYSNTVTNTNLAAQNAVANQQGLNQLGVSVVGEAVDTVANLDPLSSKSAVEVLTDNALADIITDLQAAVQAFASKRTPSAADQGGGGGKGGSGTKANPLKSNTPNDPYITELPVSLQGTTLPNSTITIDESASGSEDEIDVTIS